MILRIALLTLVVCSVAFPCSADFTLIPGVDLYLEYNDNIYLSSDNEEDDIITTVSPNIAMEWETPRLDVSLFASVTMEKYLNNTDEDRLGAGESTQAATLRALARLYREVFFLQVTDTYSRVPIDEGGRGGEGNRNINLTDSNTFSVNPFLNLPIMKDTYLRLGYTYTNLWYEEEEADDAESHLYSASLSRTLSPRVSASLSGTHQQYRPKDADEPVCTWFGCVTEPGGTYDYDKDTISFGLSYQATDRLSLNGSYGHTWFDYDVISDTDSDVWSASADYEISSNYTVGTSYSQSYTVSVDEGPRESDSLSAYIEYYKRYTVNFSISTSNNDYVEIDREEDTYGAVLSGELPFDDKTGITGLLRYSNFDRSGRDAEEFDRYGLRVSYYYDIRLGRLSTGYIYNRTESDADNGDYDNNIIFLSASLRF